MPFWNFISFENTVELRIDGDIIAEEDTWFYEWFGITNYTTPNIFRDELKKYSGKDITLWINSAGGDVFAAAGIYNALKDHDGKINVKVDGMAMSAASVVAMSGDTIQISPVGLMMIHNPSTYGISGEEKDMLKMASVLAEIKTTIINAYQIKTNRDRKEISKMMDNETWMSAKSAVNEGFADSILYMEDPAAPIENNFMYSKMSIQNKADSALQAFFEKIKTVAVGADPVEPKKKNDEKETRQSLVDLYIQKKLRNERSLQNV